eukprot:TRINITY_DN19696_c0_g1_i2.p2 TRINITY_DN19696_c0_g1~~TRINITY_DN19696_c0_g1_i2.p2  ORF type:complete len:139 (+),score=37.95 TRINITY_DN19696_c0_g1_i2:407-823(+)
MHDCGFPLPPGKASHFPGQGNAYVEYIGKVPEESRQPLLSKLEDQCNQYIATGFQVTVQDVPFCDLEAVCGGAEFVPDFVSKDKGTRVVSVCPGLGCPCGGTHVKNITEVQHMQVSGIRVKKGMTRITYGVPGTDFEV